VFLLKVDELAECETHKLIVTMDLIQVVLTRV